MAANLGHNYRGGGGGGCLRPPIFGQDTFVGQKPKKVGQNNRKIHQGAVSVCQLYYEPMERKLQTFNDVADTVFKKSFILLTTYKCLQLSVWQKTHRTFSKMKII